MSTIRRLERLGLLHLKDEPDKLLEQMEKEVAAYNEEVKRWQRERPKPVLQSAPPKKSTS